MSKEAQWCNSRKVLERIFIKGMLVLKTSASFGNGDAEGTTDIPLLLDPLDGHSPLLTGASIAGALRSYLREYQKGFGWEEQDEKKQKSQSELLFGCLDNAFINENGKYQSAAVESWLMVDDALGMLPEKHSVTELRDGVTIDPSTRTVEEDERGGHKFDIELLPAGTSFHLSFEFWKADQDDDLLAALAAALKGFQEGKIALGLRKRRGFGECRVAGWQVWRYPMDTRDGLMGWVKHDGCVNAFTGTDIASLLNVNIGQDQRNTFAIEAQFAIEQSLLIRSEGGEEDQADMVHLKSWREDAQTEQPILSGTSLAGVIRGRALRIANTLLGRENGRMLVDEMFGKRIGSYQDEASASQVVVKETVIKNVTDDMVQNRVKIDRFTGGSFPQALFSQKPLWSKLDQPQVQINLELRRPHDEKKEDHQAKVGLLLLVLKDLWTGDLPVGGESSVGRGRLRGIEADITDTQLRNWHIQQGPSSLELQGGDKKMLDDCVQALAKWESPRLEESRVKE